MTPHQTNLTAEPTWVGRSLRRFEDRRLLTGGGQYADDVRLPGALRVAVVHSPYPHARISHIDTTAARQAPGVVDVVTGADVPGLGTVAVAPFVPNVRTPHHPLLAQDVVRYVGEPVAAVLAETVQQARDAVDLIEVDWEALPVAADLESALADGAPVLHPELGSNVAFTLALGNSAEEVDAAFEQADHVVSLRIESPRICPVPLEPRSMGVEYLPDEDRFLLHPSQHAGNGGAVAQTALNVPADRFDVLAQDVGGAFGAKGTPYREELLAIYFAHKHKRSVRWTGTRSEEFLTMTGGRDQVAQVEGAFSRGGRLLALRARNLGNLGAYLYAVTPMVPTAAPRLMIGAYAVPVARGEAIGLFTNRAPTGPYRGAGRPEGILLIERLMDAAAHDLGLDPLEIRRRNLIQPDAFPYTTPTGSVYDSGDYAATLDHALQLADYPALVSRRDEARARGELFGIGFCTFVEPAGGGFESGRVRVLADGSILLESGSFNYGQGHHTTFAQVVADVLKVHPSRVTVVQGDTRRVPPGTGTFGSRSMTVGGGAAKNAALNVLEQMKSVAGHLLEVEAADVAYDGQTFHPSGVPARGVTFEQVAEAAHDPARVPEGMDPGLVSDERYSPPGTWPHGTHIAAVSVDRDTGRVRVEAFIAVDDAGVIVNPLLAHAQVVGGLAQGFGQALFEQMVYDEDGMPISGTFGDYAMPRASNLPSFVLGETCSPAPGNTLGVKGVGESGTVGAPPAIANAVIDALQGGGYPVRHLDFPLTSEKIWRALSGETAAAR